MKQTLPDITYIIVANMNVPL